MKARDRAALALEIEEDIRIAFRTHGWRLYWPRQFIDATNRKMEEVLAALADLERALKVNLIASLRCSEGHEVWTGPSTELRVGGRQCRQCQETIDSEEPVVLVHAELTSEWEQHIKHEADPSHEKKVLGAMGMA